MDRLPRQSERHFPEPGRDRRGGLLKETAVARDASPSERGAAYGAGQRLLPERDLARQLGVSRPSVREALIALEVEGYVEVRVGSDKRKAR
ncbi:MAG TPA: GntR family transcriptional regulator [Usitatibacter sp.]|nr:GntR family transcriptional regulator [Usitatibacter sp.]